MSVIEICGKEYSERYIRDLKKYLEIKPKKGKGEVEEEQERDKEKEKVSIQDLLGLASKINYLNPVFEQKYPHFGKLPLYELFPAYIYNWIDTIHLDNVAWIKDICDHEDVIFLSFYSPSFYFSSFPLSLAFFPPPPPLSLPISPFPSPPPPPLFFHL